MSKKSFIIFLVLSVIITLMVSVVVFMMDKTANQGGIPFAFTSVSLFSNANTDYLMLSLDIIFWFIILFGIWKLVGKLLKR